MLALHIRALDYSSVGSVCVDCEMDFVDWSCKVWLLWPVGKREVETPVIGNHL